jgi:ribonuclease P protein component
MDSWRGWPRRADARSSSAAVQRAAHALQSRSRPSSQANNPVRSQLSFAAADRLHRSAEFLRLQRNGVRFQSPHFVVYVSRLEHEPERSRLGVTVSRRIGNAVVRNRVKRRVRECFRKGLRVHLPVGTSIVVIARGGAGALESATINDELMMAARNLKGRIAERSK